MKVPDITPFSEITDSLYLTSYRAITEEKLRGKNITHIVNITERENLEFPDLPHLEFTHIPILDAEDSNILVHLESSVDKIQQVSEGGGKTLVHCVMGISRSATICIAYMMKHKAMSLRKAYFHVKARRPIIYPNLGFWAQMVKYEEQLYGSNTVELLPYNVGYMPSVYQDEGEFAERWALRQSDVMNLLFILITIGLYDILYWTFAL